MSPITCHLSLSRTLQARPETGRGWLGPIGAMRGRGVAPRGSHVLPAACVVQVRPVGRRHWRGGPPPCGPGRPRGQRLWRGAPGCSGRGSRSEGRAGARGGVGEFLACRRVAGVPGWCSGSPGSGRGGGTWASRSGCGDGGPAGSWLRDGARGWGLLGGRKVREVAERGGVCGHGPGARVCARAAGTCLVLSRGSRDSRASVVTFQFL